MWGVLQASSVASRSISVSRSWIRDPTGVEKRLAEESTGVGGEIILRRMECRLVNGSDAIISEGLLRFQIRTGISCL
jgi:hypothetical protein